MKKSTSKRLISLLLALCLAASMITLPAAAAAGTGAESPDNYDGSQLWLNYRLVKDSSMLDEYISGVTAIVVQNYDANPTYRHSRNGSVWTPQQPSGSKETIPASTLEAARLELARASKALLGKEIPFANDVTADGAVVVGTPETSSLIAALGLDADLAKAGKEGYVIRSVKINGKAATAIAGNTEIGALYGTYTFLRQMQTQKTIKNLNIVDQPKVNHRRLNNWDAERLYAGTNATGEGSSTGGDGSIFCFSSNSNSNRLPQILDRYIIFARACASVGINEITINNVNADYAYLSESYILMEAALADVLRPYGVHIGLSVRYVSPTQSGCNTSADTQAGGPSQISGNDANNPYAAKFQNWWTKKTEQIRSRIPDFVGYTVKANSEGQPGPQDYGYDHGDGAYGLGQALAKVNDGMENNMTLFWRTFVYNATVDTDRLKRAYMEFKPINDDPERSFGDNVFVQTKNGPLDFQGREPVHPMFGAMDQTNQAIEVQITQEYTGHHVSLCYLGTEWEEIFKTDTYANGEGTLVGDIIDGTAQGQADTAIVGVNNIGNSPNMCGNDFSQANFFSFGRQAWDWTLDAEDIAEDWTRMTWSNDDEVVDTIVAMMMGSYEALVSYQTPYGIGHQMTGTGTHYFPNPAQIIVNGGTVRDDWSPAYYGRVDGVGVGYNRTGHTEQASSALQMGSNLAGQYSDHWEEIYNDMDATPENQILWFHHVPWDYEMDDGRTFWEDAVYLMQMGVQYVSWMRDAWASLEGKIDQTRYNRVADKLFRQEIDASEWRDFYSSYWQANNNLNKPVDDGALSIAVTIGGKEYKGFDLSVDSFNKTRPGNLPSSDSRYNRYNSAGGGIADASGSPFSNMFVAVPKEYTISLPVGTSRQISKVEFLNKDYADGAIEILSNDDQQAQVKVTREGPFGMLTKIYNFKFADDATLTGIKANGIAIESFDPDTAEYAVLCGDDVINAPYITAEATDPAAAVKVKQSDTIPGKATISVKNGAASKTYTVNFARATAFTEDFNGSAPSSDWTWVRESTGKWSMANGALTISTANGDIKGNGNNAQNILLHDVGTGNWEATTKLTFSAIPSQVTQQGALIVYQDDNNFFKVNVEYQNSGAAYCRASAGIERSGSYSDIFYDALEIEEAIAASKNTVWLKIVKEGTTYRAYWATDGNAAFKALGECTANLKEPKLGTLAVSGNSNASIKVSYDNITVTDNCALLVTEDGGEHPDEPDDPTPGPTDTQHIDFTDPASAALIEIENQAAAEIREGEGLYLVSTTDAFEPCNGQISTFAPKDVVKIPAEGDWKATMKLNFNQGSSRGYYEFFGFYAMDDYDNCVGIRAGDGAIQDFLRQEGVITADTDGVKTSTGLKAAATHWFRIEKTGNSYACFWSLDGEEFTPIFSYEATGIEGNTICLDAYSGMATGYNYTIEYMDIEREAQGLPNVDFTDPASEALFQIVNQDVSEIREGEGLYMITTKDGFEDANGQLSGEAARTPKDLVLVPVNGDWTATLTFDFSQAGASNGYYQFFGFYAMQDYNNAAGIRGGDGAMQDFLRVDGAVTAETMNSQPGLASNGTYYYRIVKEGTTYTCLRSSDGEAFDPMFAFENTGIEAENIAIDAYTGMTAGYTFMLKSLEFEGGSAPQPPVHEHSFVAAVTAPTCTKGGFTTYTCACGESYIADETDPVAHEFVDGACKSCGLKAFVAAFVCDEHASVTVYDSQAEDSPKTEKATVGYARSGETGEIDVSGEGQVNFVVTADEGYEIKSVTAEPNNYKNLKAPTETGTGYRITKVTGNITVTIVTEKITCEHDYKAVVTAPTCTEKGFTTYTCSKCGNSYTAEETAKLPHDFENGACKVCGLKAYVITFACDAGASVTVYESQAEDSPKSEKAAAAYARSGDTGAIDASGDGQVNFEVVLAPGYVLKDVTAEPKNYKNLKLPEETGAGYRITKITGDFTVTVTTEKSADYVCDGGEACPSKVFTDAPKAGTWAHAGIDYCVETGLMKGVSDGIFNPNGTVTRGQLVTILYRIAGEPAFTTDKQFSDVADGRYYTKAVLWAAENSIVTGYSDGTFLPNREISREQIAAILYRYEGSPEVTGKLDFPDAAKAGSYAENALVWATQKGLITGVKTTGGTFLNPKASAPRAQIATIIMRYLES